MALRAASVVLVLAACAASLPAVAAANILCCHDERGKQVCGDILPAACVGRAYREIGANGAVVRQVDAPLTAEQRALRAAEERKKKEAEEAAREQARLDQALLQTYGSEADIDMMRQRTEADTQAGIKAAEAKIVDAQKRRKRFENEAEFYKKKALPPEIEKGLKDVDFEIKAQQSLIEAKKKDLEAIKAKYDDEKRRYLELKRVRVRTH